MRRERAACGDGCARHVRGERRRWLLRCGRTPRLFVRGSQRLAFAAQRLHGATDLARAAAAAREAAQAAANRQRQLRVHVRAQGSERSERQENTPAAQRVPRLCRRSIQSWQRGMRGASRGATGHTSCGAQRASQRGAARHPAVLAAARARHAQGYRQQVFRSGDGGVSCSYRLRAPLAPLAFLEFPEASEGHPRTPPGAAGGGDGGRRAAGAGAAAAAASDPRPRARR